MRNSLEKPLIDISNYYPALFLQQNNPGMTIAYTEQMQLMKEPFINFNQSWLYVQREEDSHSKALRRSIFIAVSLVCFMALVPQCSSKDNETFFFSDSDYHGLKMASISYSQTVFSQPCPLVSKANWFIFILHQ